MWENVNEFPKLNGESTRNIEFISLYSFAGMNGRLELCIITQPYSEVYELGVLSPFSFWKLINDH